MKIENIKEGKKILDQMNLIKSYLCGANWSIDFINTNLDKKKRIRLNNLLKEFQEEYLKELESL